MNTNWTDLARELGPALAENAAEHDAAGTFVADNYALLARHGVMGALVPGELGGGGATHAEMCHFLREVAHHCAATSLALSMHQHLVAAAVWKWRHGGAGAALLRRVAAEPLVLLSTGATDWVDSNGTMERVPGGYRVTARKVFGSGGPAADLMVTSSVHAGQVLHFTVPLDAEGVSVLQDWDTLGMRGTGSNTILLDRVFVPDDAITLRRPQGAWHPVWTVVVTVALPLVMSTYVGLAEAARDAACGLARPEDPHAPYILGELEREVFTARDAWSAMIAAADGYAFDTGIAAANAALVRKAVCTKAALAAVEKAMEASGGRGFFRSSRLEQMLRDVHAAPYHPLPEKKQALFSGRLALGLDPVRGAPLREPVPV